MKHTPTEEDIQAYIDVAPSVKPQEPSGDEWEDGYKRAWAEAEVFFEQEPKIGHWIEEDMFDGDVAYRCSECNELFWIESGTPKDNGYNFCPKCGKRLVEPQESEDKK